MNLSSKKKKYLNVGLKVVIFTVKLFELKRLFFIIFITIKIFRLFRYSGNNDFEPEASSRVSDA